MKEVGWEGVGARGTNRVAGVGVERAGRAGAACARQVVVDRPEPDREVVADPGVGERVGRLLKDVHPTGAVGLERSGTRKVDACVCVRAQGGGGVEER